MSKIYVELTVAGKDSPVSIQVDDMAALRVAAQEHVGDADFHLLEKDQEEALTDIDGRRAISAVAHRCKKVLITVVFDRQITEDFPPSTTVFKILSWAVGKKGFNLDDNQVGKANLVLPGADSPLPRDALIGQYVTASSCAITLNLTLKDFTNGSQ